MDQVNIAGRKNLLQNNLYNLHPLRFSLQIAKNKMRGSIILVLSTDQTEAKKTFKKQQSKCLQ